MEKKKRNKVLFIRRIESGNEIGKGTIVAIGLDDAKNRGIKASEVVIVSNLYDMTDEMITEDPIEYDWNEWIKMQEYNYNR